MRFRYKAVSKWLSEEKTYTQRRRQRFDVWRVEFALVRQHGFKLDYRKGAEGQGGGRNS